MTRKSKSQSEESKPEEKSLPPSSGAEEETLSATRKALIEEESQAEADTGVFKKVARRLKGKKPASRQRVDAPEAERPATASPAPSQEGSDASKEQSAREAEEILSVLEQVRQEIEATAKTEAQAAVVEEVRPTETTPEPPRPEAVSLSDLRGVALEGYEETAAPSPSKPHKPISERLENWTDRIQYRTLVRMTLASLTAVVCLATVIIGLFVMRLPPVQFSRPTPVPTVVVPTLASPIPMQVRLPGGWGFVLSRGEIVEGKWTPEKAEWLDGTEICRWVSLPYSQQLEAVMKTFKAGDRIDLVMTNYDHWSYYVRSVSTVKNFELAGMDKNYPSLLLILTKSDSDERLVIFAAPR